MSTESNRNSNIYPKKKRESKKKGINLSKLKSFYSDKIINCNSLKQISKQNQKPTLVYINLEATNEPAENYTQLGSFNFNRKPKTYIYRYETCRYTQDIQIIKMKRRGYTWNQLYGERIRRKSGSSEPCWVKFRLSWVCILVRKREIYKQMKQLAPKKENHCYLIFQSCIHE